MTVIQFKPRPRPEPAPPEMAVAQGAVERPRHVSTERVDRRSRVRFYAERARFRTVIINNEPVRLPFPEMVFAIHEGHDGSFRDLYAFGATQPFDGSQRLRRLPLPNIMRSGRVCLGSALDGVANGSAHPITAFWETSFSGDWEGTYRHLTWSVISRRIAENERDPSIVIDVWDHIADGMFLQNGGRLVPGFSMWTDTGDQAQLLRRLRSRAPAIQSASTTVALTCWLASLFLDNMHWALGWSSPHKYLSAALMSVAAVAFFGSRVYAIFRTEAG